jgi:hypothetical protein
MPVPHPQYTHLRSLASNGQIRSLAMGQAGTLAALHDCGQEDVEDPLPTCDQALLGLARTEHGGAFLSLRCRGSWTLEEAVKGLHRKYQRVYQLELAELAGFALDDVGRRYPYQENGDARAGRVPLAVEAVRSWEPAQSGLPHWARRCLEYRNDLKQYLREQGILLIGTWALLADCSATRVREAMERSLVRTTLSAEEAVALHRRYVPLYRAAKLRHRNSTGRQRGWQPDEPFLEALEAERPTATTRETLEGIAAALRSLCSGQWQREEQRLLVEGGGDQLDNVAAPASGHLALDAEASEAPDLAEKARMALQTAGMAYFSEMLSKIPADERDQQLCFWSAWLRGASTREIAEQCKAAQARVSRRLQVERRAREIASAALEQLRNDLSFGDVFRSTESLDRAAQGLANHLLSPEQEGDEPPLRQMLRTCLETPSP